MRVTWSTAERSSGIVPGKTNYYVDTTVVFSEEERAIIEARGLAVRQLSFGAYHSKVPSRSGAGVPAVSIARSAPLVVLAIIRRRRFLRGRGGSAACCCLPRAVRLGVRLHRPDPSTPARHQGIRHRGPAPHKRPGVRHLRRDAGARKGARRPNSARSLPN